MRKLKNNYLISEKKERKRKIIKLYTKRLLVIFLFLCALFRHYKKIVFKERERVSKFSVIFYSPCLFNFIFMFFNIFSSEIFLYAKKYKSNDNLLV